VSLFTSLAFYHSPFDNAFSSTLGPLVFGALIDATCAWWQQEPECMQSQGIDEDALLVGGEGTRTGVCLEYNAAQSRLMLFLVRSATLM
jgi:hypothetical protein